MYCDHLLLPWFERLREDVPGLELFDAHTHVGLHDPSGFNATVQELVAALELVDSRALVFPLREPSGYDKANARVVDWAAESAGRLAALAPRVRTEGRVAPPSPPRFDAGRGATRARSREAGSVPRARRPRAPRRRAARGGRSSWPGTSAD
jgi:hypothetical protein